MLSLTTNTLLITLCFVFLSNDSAFGQDDNQPQVVWNKSSISASLGGGDLWDYGTATAYYERILNRKKSNPKASTFLKGGVGTTISRSNNIFIIAQYGILTGQKNHHLEFALGAGYFQGKNQPWSANGPGLKGAPVISSTLGWRIQKPDGEFMFRTGLSWPEGIYIGLGVPF